MFKNLFRKKKKEEKVIEEVTPKEPFVLVEIYPNAKLDVTKKGNFIKVEINMNLIPLIYEKLKKESGYSELLDLLSPSVYWESSSQMIKEGTYYIIPVGNCTYNILFSGNRITINESMDLGDISKQTILEFDIPETEYHMKNISLTVFKHNEEGSTIDHKLFINNFKFSIHLPELELSRSEACAEVESLLDNLKVIEGIETVIDLEMVRNIVLGELKDKPMQQELKNN